MIKYAIANFVYWIDIGNAFCQQILKVVNQTRKKIPSNADVCIISSNREEFMGFPKLFRGYKGAILLYM